MKQRLHRPCSRCNERFLPTGKGNRICEKCIKESHVNRAIKLVRLNYGKPKVKGGIN